jgi:tetratricopeptide (TPR) repeat protein
MIELNIKGVVMFDRNQLVLAGMSIAIALNLNQQVSAVPVRERIQFAATASNTEADKVYTEAKKLYEQGTKEALISAIAKYEVALKLYREAGDRGKEAVILNNIGLVYDNLGEKQKALDYYNQSLPLSRAVGDRSVEASFLTTLAESTKILERNKKL